MDIKNPHRIENGKKQRVKESPQDASQDIDNIELSGCKEGQEKAPKDVQKEHIYHKMTEVVVVPHVGKKRPRSGAEGVETPRECKLYIDPRRGDGRELEHHFEKPKEQRPTYRYAKVTCPGRLIVPLLSFSK